MDVAIARLREIHAGPLDPDLHVGALLPEALSIVRPPPPVPAAPLPPPRRTSAAACLAARGHAPRSMYSRTEEDCREKACAVCTRGVFRSSRASRRRRARALSPQFGNIGGPLSWARPAAEGPAVLLLLQLQARRRSAAGRRRRRRRRRRRWPSSADNPPPPSPPPPSPPPQLCGTPPSGEKYADGRNKDSVCGDRARRSASMSTRAARRQTPTVREGQG